MATITTTYYEVKCDACNEEIFQADLPSPEAVRQAAIRLGWTYRPATNRDDFEAGEWQDICPKCQEKGE